ncbi:FAD-dependent oxidoreductase [Neptunicella sp. SCSIO 80796]|uniref:FAD-dependent oxidoreductase n=1 Tax=Neptunicella plasticusilytica TaxID=3117012 RepID=UPI003A4DF4C3
MSHIAILGAGLIGRLLALLLAKVDCPSTTVKVSLFERQDINTPNTTGRVAAAMVAPLAESVNASSHIVEMGQQSLLLWPQLLRYLQLTTTLQQTGTLVLAHRQDHNEMRHFQQRLKCTDRTQCQTLTPAQLHHLEPELDGHFNQALWLSDEAHIDNQQLYDETATALKSSPINLFEQHQAELVDDDLVVNQQAITCDWVIDCRGMGAKQAWLDPDNALRGVRGEVIRVYAPEVNLQRPVRLMHPRYALYIVPKAHHQFVIGATEIESEGNKAPSIRSTLELLSAAYSIHKGFAEAEIVSVQAALRPTLRDNQPAIVCRHNIIQVNGLYRHGYLLAPYVLQHIMLLLHQAGLPCRSFCSHPASVHSTLVTYL